MHLQVSDLDESLTYYKRTFGLKLKATLVRQVGFVSCEPSPIW